MVDADVDELAAGLRDAVAWLRTGYPHPDPLTERRWFRRRVVATGWFVALSAGGEQLALTTDARTLIDRDGRWVETTRPDDLARALGHVAEWDWMGGPLA